MLACTPHLRTRHLDLTGPWTKHYGLCPDYFLAAMMMRAEPTDLRSVLNEAQDAVPADHPVGGRRR
jgi:hypothetical protein